MLAASTGSFQRCTFAVVATLLASWLQHESILQQAGVPPITFPITFLHLVLHFLHCVRGRCYIQDVLTLQN